MAVLKDLEDRFFGGVHPGHFDPRAIALEVAVFTRGMHAGAPIEARRAAALAAPDLLPANATS